jgi:AcrR family transcriptional regulator
LNNLERRTQTKATIMQSATTSFACNGYEATGVAEICAGAGVSKGAFYYHFESKEAVLLELIDSWLKTIETNLSEVTFKADSVPEGLMEMAGMMQAVFDNNRFFMGLFLELWTNAHRNEKVRQATMAPYARFKAIFSALIQRGITEKSLEDIDPETAGQLLLSLSSGFFLQAALEPDLNDWGVKLQNSIEILLDGLRWRND